jgi:hypothetical protein
MERPQGRPLGPNDHDQYCRKSNNKIGYGQQMNRLRKGLRSLNPVQLVEKSKFIEDRMKGNPAFTDPTPALADITAARSALETAITEAMDGSRTATAVKHSRAAELKLLLNQLAGYVSSLVEGNRLAILSSGFDVRRAAVPASEPAMPTGLQAAISPHAGQVDLRWLPVKHALAYEVFCNRVAPGNAEDWVSVGTSTRANFKVSGLASASTTWFRVRALGTAGTGPLSDVAHSLAR